MANAGHFEDSIALEVCAENKNHYKNHMREHFSHYVLKPDDNLESVKKHICAKPISIMY